MSDRLPAVVSALPRDLRTFLDRVRDILRDKSGTRLVTADELVSAGIAATGSSGQLTVGTGVPYLPPPPAPVGVIATAAIQNIIVEWDAPNYNGHAYAEVWASETNNLGSAVLLGLAPGGIYVDPVGPGVTQYYWVRFVNTNNVTGPYNAVAGTGATTELDLAYTMYLLSDTYGGTSEAPFFQLDSPTVINGVTIPAGTYMKAAFIYDGVITNAKIANAAVDNAKIANLDAAKITTGFLSADRIQAGTLDAKIANLDAAKITSGFINAARINTASIANANITAAQITSGFVDAARINTASIANATISNAQITSLDAAKITTGFLDAARISANTINADMIISRSATYFTQHSISVNGDDADGYNSTSIYMDRAGYVAIVANYLFSYSGSSCSWEIKLGIDESGGAPYWYQSQSGSFYSSAGPNGGVLQTNVYLSSGYHNVYGYCVHSCAGSDRWHVVQFLVLRSYR